MYSQGASEASGTVSYIDTNTYQYQYALRMVININTSVLPFVPFKQVSTISTKRLAAVPYYVSSQERQGMRKIEQQMIQAIKDNKDWQLDNTRVEYYPETSSSCVYLHGNHIATVTDTDVTIYDGGWQSNTTKSRLNAICNAFCVSGEGVFQKNFDWFIHKFVGQAGQSKVYNTIPFVNGYIFA